MEICIFYSWQNQYKDFCDKIIGAALRKAVKILNSESTNITYIVLRGGRGLIGSEDIMDGINVLCIRQKKCKFASVRHNFC